jgi:hypothetical protein
VVGKCSHGGSDRLGSEALAKEAGRALIDSVYVRLEVIIDEESSHGIYLRGDKIDLHPKLPQGGKMKFPAIVLVVLATASPALVPRVLAYPPTAGILSKSTSCLACHLNNGPWPDDQRTIIDLIDKETNKSLKQLDGTFLIETKRGVAKTLLTVIGRAAGDSQAAPYRNAWLYIDPRTIDTASLSKFAPGWDVNLPMACRIVGDKHAQFKDAAITVLPMTVRPSDAAQDAELSLQVMLTRGESIKGKPKEGMTGSYFERKVRLKVIE